MPISIYPFTYAVLGVALGLLAFAASVCIIPKLLARFTPHIDEEREILKGNEAVALYFGLVVAATILGLAVIIAAAVFAGIHE